MLIIPLDFTIERDPKNGKKLYKKGSKIIGKPLLPTNWHKLPIEGSTPIEDRDSIFSYAIRCDDDTIVIDCDDLESTEFINDKLVPTPSKEPDHYIVQSDKGERHYYFKPSDYYRNSPIYKLTRLRVGKIDILHGRALVFTPCKGNKTKQILQGSLTELTPIPDNIVDALVNKFKDTLTSSEADADYRPLASYLAPRIEQALALYARKPDYNTYLLPLFQVITPQKYRRQVEPSYHPDLIEDGEGTEYIQAIFTRLAQDPSVSLTLLTELITLITQTLWSQPWPEARLKSFIDYMPHQKFAATQKPVFVYDQKAVERPLVSINGNEYMPLYRTVDDDYIISKPSGAVEIIKGLSNFKKAMASKNYDIIVNNTKINLDTNIGQKKLAELLKTVHLRNTPAYPTGEYEEEGSLYYNTYRPSKFLGIIRSQYKQDEVYHGESSHPTITRIIKNVMLDNLLAENSSPETIVHGPNMYNKFIEFLAHKLKTLDYSPLVFQLMGNRGIGKSLLVSVLDMLTNGVVEVSFSKSNAQFNEEQENALFLNEDEGLITGKLVNSIKKMSGKSKILIEGKGKTPYLIRNVGTYICTTNKTSPLAETVDDRRFVTFSGFKANRIIERDINLRIAMELESFALCLRDTKLTDQIMYLDANKWHDSIHLANFAEKQDSAQDGAGRLANLVYNLNVTTGYDLHQQLTEILGEGYHAITSRRQPNALFIPLNKSSGLVRATDHKPLTHSITREQCKAAGLDNLISMDKNGVKTVYKTNYYRLILELAPQQIMEWQDAYTYGREEIAGDDSTLDLKD